MTYTALLATRDGRWSGLATATCALAVGAMVPAVAPGVGVVASQAWTNRALRSLALACLREDMPPVRVLDRLRASDDEFERRQVGILAASGDSAVHTGLANTPWAGGRSGQGWAAFGNCLAGPGVVDVIAERLQGAAAESKEDLIEQLMAALFDGQAAGGDVRGRQSAALLVVDHTRPDVAPPVVWCDLRVDDSPDPLAALQRLVGLFLEDQ